MQEPEISPVDPMSLADLVGEERVRKSLELAAEVGPRVLDGKVWCVNSTATGGGVAEMLKVDLAYLLGAGVDAGWLVMEGESEFFSMTKRIHNRLHGSKGDDGQLGDRERELYDRVTKQNADELLERVNDGDIVILHDPQTAGLIEYLCGKGIATIWRCHVGKDDTNEYTDEAWDFLKPYLSDAHGYVFSREQYVPDFLDSDKVTIIPPAIDPASPKNQDLDLKLSRSILAAAGLIQPEKDAPEAKFTDFDGNTFEIEHQAEVVREGDAPSADTKLVVQVSRWDRLKDMAGVLRGFAEHVAGRPDCDGSHLILAGPSVAGVSDDPEGQEVFEECVELWKSLDDHSRSCITLAQLPMDDVTENAAIVNALQRHACVVVQKSIVEGFGLTVAEAMWKSRPVVATAVGGIQDQIIDGETGVLLQDPEDLAEFGKALGDLLADIDRAHELGRNARERVLEHFLPDRQLAQWGEVVVRLEQTGGSREDLEKIKPLANRG